MYIPYLVSVNLLCENDSQRPSVVAVEPDTVLMQDGAKQLRAEARNLSF